ncbi:hypothetical protein HYX00_06910 [Candidatus Woesearchaeota archaeon]|nr:hypothetical protein [Candidatus Woesearchaeota archaeon]
MSKKIQHFRVVKFLKRCSFLNAMGQFGRRPDSGGRAGASERKRNKEIAKGRLERKPPIKGRIERGSLRKSSANQWRRELDYLQVEVRKQRDAAKREPLYERFVNCASRLLPQADVLTEIRGIEGYSGLADNDLLSDLSRGSFRGSIDDFLPLHHLVKLLGREVPNKKDDKFIYLLGSTSTSTPAEASVRNLRGLEYFLLGFAARLPEKQYLELHVDGKRFQVPYHNEHFEKDNDSVVITMKRRLDAAGLIPSEHYTLGKINDGYHKVHGNLHIVAEQRAYKADNGQMKSVAIAYLTTRYP